jgi:hypothetical protein
MPPVKLDFPTNFFIMFIITNRGIITVLQSCRSSMGMTFRRRHYWDHR